MDRHQDIFTAKRRSIEEIKKEHKKLDALIKQLDTKVSNHQLSRNTGFLSVSMIENQRDQVKKGFKKVGEKQQTFRSVSGSIIRTFENIYRKEKTEDAYRRYSYMRSQINREIEEIEKTTRKFKEKFDYIMKYAF